MFGPKRVAQRAEIPGFVEKALRGLFGLHSSRFLQWLTLGCFDFEGENDYSALYPILAGAGPRPTMRKLFIGDTNSEEQELSWTSAGDLNAISGLYPALSHSRIRAGSMVLEGALESLVVESGGLSQESVRAVANASFPELRQLEIWTGSRSYGGTSTDAAIEALKTGLGPGIFVDASSQKQADGDWRYVTVGE